MQVSATLIAAQQAAREARARLQVPQAAPAAFAAALDKTAGISDGFSALPLKQTAAPASAPMAQTPASAPARMGQHINILV